MIEKTGGSLRDLFGAIITAATRARRRRSVKIEVEDAVRALEKLKTELKKTIDGKNYSFLADISRGNRERIEDKEMLLNMLQAGTVLEYNGKGWYNVHPLVNDFLIEQGILGE
jgi:ATP phosphoribosyltransferase